MQKLQGAILIYGGNSTQRQQKTNEILRGLFGEKTTPAENPDIQVVNIPEEKKSIGVEEVKTSLTFLEIKPLLNHKALVFPQADAILPKAQNLLLKTLEEPPAHATIILSAKTRGSIIETVISRCRHVAINTQILQEKNENATSLKEILAMNLDEKLKWAAEEAKNEKPDILEQLADWLLEGRGVILEKGMGKNLELIIEIKTDLENTNVLTKLALENLVVNLN